LGWGGAQRQLVNLAVGLRRRGHEVHLYAYMAGYDHLAALVHDAGVVLVETDKRFALDPRPLASLVAYARRHGFDAGVAFLPTPSTYAVLAARLAGRFPVVVSERSFFEGRVSLDDRLRRQPHRLAAHVTANSHHQRERLVREFPWMEGRISTIWNGVDTEVFHPGSPETAPPEAGGSGALRVLGVGSLLKVKEIPLLAEALLGLHERGGPEVRVDWAGRPDPDESAAIEARVGALLEPAGLASRWRWLGLRRDVPELHRSHDVLVHPSATEGLPNAICEGLASGLPVVASRAGDHPRLVEEGARGFLFAPGDAGDLARAIARAVEVGPDGRRAIGARGRAFAERELSRDAYVSHYEALLEGLVAGRAR